MAAKTQRGDLMSLGWLALMDFSATDTQGVVYDYSNPVLTPPIMFGAQHKWVQGANGFWLPQTALDADGNSTCGPIGGWLRVPPGGHVRTQPQWAASPFLAQVQSVGPPLEVAVMKNSSGALETQLSDTFQATVMPGAATPNVNDWGLLVQPTRLDAQDPVWVPLKSGTSGGGGAASFYGDASDGDVHLDGTTGAFVPDYFVANDASGAHGYGYLLTQCYAQDGSNAPGIGNAGATNVFNPLSFTNGSKYYFLWRPAFFNHLTIDAGVTLFTNGFPVFAKKISGAGTIDCSGNIEYKINNLSTGWQAMNPNPANTNTILAFVGAMLGTANVGHGHGGANGDAATQQANFLHVINALDAGGGLSCFAKGGSGGNGGGFTGGGGVYGDGRDGSQWHTALRLFGAASVGANATGTGLNPGPNGGLYGFPGQPGSGGGGDTSTGGDGGLSGGWVGINAFDMSGFTGVISANGEDGYPGGMGGNAGGGGGGSGGILQVATDPTATPSKTWTTTVTRGNFGVGVGTGTNGTVGSDGLPLGTYP